MADTKITQLATLTSLADADLFVAIDNVAVTPASTSVRMDTIKTYIEQQGEVPPYYAISAAETAESVTPSDYSYVWGNVLRYGADPTGVVDSKTALQNAINVINTAGGGVVLLPVGTYLLATSIEIKTGVVLRGEGWNSIIKLKDSAAASLTTIQSGSSAAMIYTDDATANDFAIENLAIDGNDANNSANTYWGIGLADANSFQIRNVKVTDVYGASVGTFLCNDFQIADCTFREITGTTGNPGEGMYIRKSWNFAIDNCLGVDLDDHLIYLSGTNSETTQNGVINNCIGINCGRTSNSSAFNALDGIRKITFSDCHSYDSKRGFTLIGTADAVRDITYIGCTAYSSDDATSPSGFACSSSSGTRHARIKFVGCKAYDNGVGTASAVGYGFNLQDVNDLTLDDCEGSANNYDGLWIDTCDRVRISGRFRSNGQEPSVANRAGIRIDDCDEVYVDAMCFDNDYGVVAGAAATNCLIRGYFEGNATAPYLKDASTAGSVVFDNVPNTNSDVIPTVLLGTAAPTSKTWTKGHKVINASPDDGEPVGWICTTGGAPGTWRAFGQIHYRSGSGSPSGVLTPNFVGEEYLDTSGNAWYKAYGLVNTNWQAL